MPDIKMYVWEHVLCDYTCGLIVAIATSEAEARQAVAEMAQQGALISPRDFADAPEVYDPPHAIHVWGGG